MSISAEVITDELVGLSRPAFDEMAHRALILELIAEHEVARKRRPLDGNADCVSEDLEDDSEGYVYS